MCPIAGIRLSRLQLAWKIEQVGNDPVCDGWPSVAFADP